MLSLEDPRLRLEAVSPQRCQIYHFQCDKKDDQETIQKLAELAQLQEDEFLSGSRVLLKPWKKQCAPNVSMYIATSRMDVCGWLVVFWTKYANQKFVYVHEVATKTLHDETYNGVSTALIQSVIKDATQKGYRYMQLWSFPAAKEAYQKIGFRTSLNTNNMWLPLNGRPSRLARRKMMRKVADKVVAKREYPEVSEILELIDPDRGTKLTTWVEENSIEQVDVIVGNYHMFVRAKVQPSDMQTYLHEFIDDLWRMDPRAPINHSPVLIAHQRVQKYYI